MSFYGEFIKLILRFLQKDVIDLEDAENDLLLLDAEDELVPYPFQINVLFGLIGTKIQPELLTPSSERLYFSFISLLNSLSL